MHDPASFKEGETPESNIVRQFLDQVAEALMADDFDGYARLIDLPFVITTQNERFVRTDRTELKHGFEMWRRTLDVNRITHFIQRVQSVESFADNTIIAVYDTDLLCGSLRPLPSFTNWIFLRRKDDQWLLEQLLSGVSNTSLSQFIEVDPQNTAPLQ